MPSADDNRAPFGRSDYLLAHLASALRRCGVHVWRVQSRALQTEVVTVPPELAADVEFRRLVASDIDRVARPEFALTRDFVERAFERGDTCSAAFNRDNELVGYAWRATDVAPVNETLWLRVIAPHCRYGYKGWVAPTYRNRRINHFIAHYEDPTWVALGITRSIAYMELGNLPSRASSARRLGLEWLGYAGYVEVGRLVFTFRTRRVREAMELFTTV